MRYMPVPVEPTRPVIKIVEFASSFRNLLYTCFDTAASEGAGDDDDADKNQNDTNDNDNGTGIDVASTAGTASASDPATSDSTGAKTDENAKTAAKVSSSSETTLSKNPKNCRPDDHFHQRDAMSDECF